MIEEFWFWLRIGAACVPAIVLGLLLCTIKEEERWRE